MSSAVTLETDRSIEIDAQSMNQGIELDLCIALPPSDNIDTVCDQVISRLAPFFVAGLMWDEQAGALIDVSVNASKNTAVSNKLQQMAGGCSRGRVTDCSCSCLFVTKHLTSFVVADVGGEELGEESSSLESAKHFNAQVKAAAEASSEQQYDIEQELGSPPNDGQGGSSGDASAIVGAVVAVLVAIAAAAAFVHRRWSRTPQQLESTAQHATEAGSAPAVITIAQNPMKDADAEVTGEEMGEVAEI
jgi:hypothetical protein